MSSRLAERLREATGPFHVSVERALPLTRCELTVDAYRRILGAFLGFYGPLEAGLVRLATCSAELNLIGREKISWLRQDLCALGASESDLAAIPTCPDLPRVDAVDRAFGCMYVLEGATLGGQIIARNLEQHLAMGAQSCAFFRAYGAATGTMWRTFVAHLNRQEPPFDGAVAAAVETFECLERWLVARGAPTWQK